MNSFDHTSDVLPLLRERLPQQQGDIQEGPLASMVTCYGDYGLSVAYAALFAPKIQLSANVPVDLLHHQGAANRTPEFYRALGEALASFWTRQLSASAIKGRFVYDESTGYDVVYKADERDS
jgi:hypothetical protein